MKVYVKKRIVLLIAVSFFVLFFFETPHYYYVTTKCMANDVSTNAHVKEVLSNVTFINLGVLKPINAYGEMWARQQLRTIIHKNLYSLLPIWILFMILFRYRAWKKEGYSLLYPCWLEHILEVLYHYDGKRRYFSFS